VFATSAIVVTGVVGFMWLWLGDAHPPLLASLGLAFGIHVTVAAEIFVLSRLPDPETAGHCCGQDGREHAGQVMRFRPRESALGAMKPPSSYPANPGTLSDDLRGLR
jgi:hypothetical protein